jgi:hypothetical protein
VRWVPQEREESKGGAGGSFLKPRWLDGVGQNKGERRGHAGVSTWMKKEGEKGGPGMAVGSVGWLAAAPGHRVRAVPLPCEQERAAGVGDGGG